MEILNMVIDFTCTLKYSDSPKKVLPFSCCLHIIFGLFCGGDVVTWTVSGVLFADDSSKWWVFLTNYILGCVCSTHHSLYSMGFLTKCIFSIHLNIILYLSPYKFLKLFALLTHAMQSLEVDVDEFNGIWNGSTSKTHSQCKCVNSTKQFLS